MHSAASNSTYVTLSDGRVGIVVVDPLTRKLTIPCEHVAETKAQHRQTIPSLCQLFLAGRCRQGPMCHQVHADPFIVNELRRKIDRLPVCCVAHGDEEFTHGPDDHRVIHLPSVQWNDGFVPLRHLSFTQGLKKIMDEAGELTQVIETPSGSKHSVTLCRLHVMDRCRFAEECRFLHVCKEVVDLSQLQQSSFHSSQSGGHSSIPCAPPALVPHQFGSCTPPLVSPHLTNSSTEGNVPQLSFLDIQNGSEHPNTSFAELSVTSMNSGSYGGSYCSSTQVSPSSNKKVSKYDSGRWSYEPYSIITVRPLLLEEHI